MKSGAGDGKIRVENETRPAVSHHPAALVTKGLKPVTSKSDSYSSGPAVGERFVLVRDVDRFPHFIATSGSKGTVVDVSGDAVSLRLDDPLPGAEEWDNEVIWNAELGQDFRRDAKPLGPADADADRDDNRAEALEPKFTMTRVDKGDYLLPDDNENTLWRLRTYDEEELTDPSTGEYRVFRRWGIWRWRFKIKGNQHRVPNVFDEDDWEHFQGFCKTRRDAITDALKAGAREGGGGR